MLLTMKAPASRDKGQRTVRCNEQQAKILRLVGWTDVITNDLTHRSMDEYQQAWASGTSPSDQTLEPEPVVDPDEVRPQHERQGISHDPDARGHEEVGRKKRTYHRRVVNVEPDGKVNYSIKPPKRRYRRRDLTAEE